MKILEKNLINLFGERGHEWFESLPKIIDTLKDFWSLKDSKPVTNMSWNYVAKAFQQKIPVVLKISCDKNLILDEYKALKHFNGHGAIQVIDINHDYNAILLEQAVPGDLLKDHYPKNIKETINIYSSVVKELATRPLSNKSDFIHVSHWLKAIDRITDSRVEHPFIDKAQELRERLLDTTRREYVCHGDLHLENIIHHQSTWLAIDPKGVIGEMAFEAAAFDLMSNDEIKANLNLSALIETRVHLLSKGLEIDFNRLLSWVYLRIIISAQWFIEDNGDPSNMLVLAKNVYPLVNNSGMLK